MIWKARQHQQMKRTTRDNHHDDDRLTLRACVLSFKLDFIKWVNTQESLDALRRYPSTIEGLVRSGVRATLHDVDLPKLRALPAEVTDRPLASVEFTIDMRVPTKEAKLLSPDQHLDRLWKVQRMVFRRLAPWTSPHVANRIYSVQGSESTSLRRGHWHRPPKQLGVDDQGKPVLGIYEGVDPELARPRLTRNGKVVSNLLYFGHKVAAQWRSYGSPPAAGAQLRVYVKTSDNHVDLAREEWSVRVEAVVNREYLKVVKPGLQLVGDLCSVTSFRPWLKPLFQLCRPEYRPLDGRRERGTVHRGRLRQPEQVQRYAFRAAATRALRRWERGHCLLTSGTADLRWVSDPDLTERLMGAVSDFHRARRHHTTSQVLAAAKSPESLEISPPTSAAEVF